MKLSLAMYDHINLSRVNTFIQRKLIQIQNEPIQINNSRRGASKVRGLEENR